MLTLATSVKNLTSPIRTNAPPARTTANTAPHPVARNVPISSNYQMMGSVQPAQNHSIFLITSVQIVQKTVRDALTVILVNSVYSHWWYRMGSVWSVVRVLILIKIVGGVLLVLLIASDVMTPFHAKFVKETPFLT